MFFDMETSETKNFRPNRKMTKLSGFVLICVKDAIVLILKSFNRSLYVTYTVYEI